mmetsp:Transcript_2190/g.7040  ORF Transcript_2190/g.7040 Transcript_2190/m.7040 type:complete len:103 (+) Transcript_2190:1273-1581(+)
MSRTVDFGCASFVAIFQSFGSMGVRSSSALARVRIASFALAPCMRADAAETRDGLELASRAVARCRCLCSRDEECFEFAARDAAVDDKERDMWCALFAYARV